MNKADRKLTAWECVSTLREIAETEGHKLQRQDELKFCIEVLAEQNAKMIARRLANPRVNAPEYSSWQHMIARCTNPKHPDYALYGGRGITVCKRWRTSFDQFFFDMKRRPKGYHLDRFPDMNGNYELSNCRWASARDNQNNRRNNIRITIDGITRTVAEWARTEGANPVKRIYDRIRKGWVPSDAVFLSYRGPGQYYARRDI